MSVNRVTPKVQRALVLQGGGALGAYEAGVLNILCKLLRNENEENGEENELLFDIIAGTSIGAVNGAILVSQFLETQSWEKAAEKLERFWTNQLSLKCLDISQLSKPWHDKWKTRDPAAASEETARRYYSVRKLLLDKMRNNMYYLESIINDDRFSDNLYSDEGPNDDNPNCKDPNCKKPNFLNNVWFLHSSKPLQESIEKYVKFPILTDRKNMQPRLLVFSVDVAEGTTVTFDSYPKADGCRKSEYSKYENEGGCENVINYNDGIGMDHIMASSTLPEFYKYREVPINPTVEQKNQNSTTIHEKSNKNKNNNVRYFWDGGLLCNTPLREPLNAHQEYWKEVENIDEIPALDIYIVNVHPSKVDIDKIPKDHDGVKDRQNDITYGDRTSHYDEKMTRLITDYTNFAIEMKRLVEEAICIVNVNDKDVLKKKLEDILAIKAFDYDGNEKARNYGDLIRGRFELNKVIRIERTNYINSIYGKTGDLTLETISKLIKEGESDARFTLIQQGINELQGSTDIVDIQNNMSDILDQAIINLKDNDYEDNNSHTYRKLTEFIEAVKKNKELIDKSKTHQSVRLIDLAERFQASLD